MLRTLSDPFNKSLVGLDHIVAIMWRIKQCPTKTTCFLCVALNTVQVTIGRIAGVRFDSAQFIRTRVWGCVLLFEALSASRVVKYVTRDFKT